MLQIFSVRARGQTISSIVEAKLAEEFQGISISAADLLLSTLEPVTTIVVSTIETLRTIGAGAFSTNRAFEDHPCSIYRRHMAI